MWDRWRSGMGGGAGGGGGGADQQQHQPGAKTRASALSPSAPASTMASTLPQGNNNSWQPRSSVIAARQQGQPQRQQTFDSSRLAGKAGPPPPRPPRDHEAVSAPPAREPYQPRALQHRSQTLPPSAPPLAQNNGYRDSVGRPPSSVYSQPPSLYTDSGRAHNGSRYTTSPGEVSPPSSPEFSAADHVPNHDISPIDEESDFITPSAYSHQHSRPPPAPKPATKPSDHASLPSRQRAASRQGGGDLAEVREAPAPKSPTASTARSNIPMMRRERRQQKEAQAAANRLRSMSGREEGRVVVPPPARGLGISTVVASPPESPEQQRQPPRSGSRAGEGGGKGLGGGGGGGGGGGSGGGGPVRRQAQGPPPTSHTDPAATVFVASRPGWKGASGRTAIVDPVKDNPEAEPLRIPPRSARRTSPRPADGGSAAAVEQEQQQQPQQGQGQQQGLNEDHGAGAGASVRVNDSVAVTGLGQRLGEEGGGSVDAAISGATISPETLALGGQQMGGGGGAGKGPLSNSITTAAGTTTTTPPSTTNTTNMNTNTTSTTSNNNHNNNKTSLASTLRKIIPSSGQRQSRIFSGSALINSLGGQKYQHHHHQQQQLAATNQQGYPSPPLSGTASTPTGFPFQQGGSGTGAVSAGGSPTGAIHAPTTGDAVQIDAYASTQWPTGAPHPPSTFPLTSSSAGYPHDHQDAIRRKEIGSGPPSAAPTQQHGTGHRPHESFSSSVYSRPEDDHQHHHPSYPYQDQYQPQDPPRQLPHPIHLNTKNLPSLPGEGSSDSPYVQPPSRFSITTYATSGRESSPRDSFDTQAQAPPPLPTPPKDIVMGLARKNSGNKAPQGLAGSGPDPLVQADSVLERRRPELRGGENRWSDALADDVEPVKISLSKTWMSTAGANSAGINATSSPPRVRKQAPKGPRDLHLSSQPRGEIIINNNNNNIKESGGARGFGFGFLSPRSPGSGSDSNNSRPASILSNVDKDLPPAPSVAAATAATTTDRIAQLNAQLQDLANRRININRAIKQMTELMPKDNLIMPEEVRKKREEEKRKIEDLKIQLSDIQGEEHDLGMKLHRAYKKLDKQTEYEPTTLWVRRATGS